MKPWMRSNAIVFDESRKRGKRAFSRETTRKIWSTETREKRVVDDAI
jgi:hypothetical protein